MYYIIAFNKITFYSFRLYVEIFWIDSYEFFLSRYLPEVFPLLFRIIWISEPMKQRLQSASQNITRVDKNLFVGKTEYSYFVLSIGRMYDLYCNMGCAKLEYYIYKWQIKEVTLNILVWKLKNEMDTLIFLFMDCL